MKSAQLHLSQHSSERFVFKIQYCHPVKRSNRKILFQQEKMFWSRRGEVFQTTIFKCFCFWKATQSKSFSIISSVLFCVTVRWCGCTTVRESLKTWIDFLTACVQLGLSYVKQSCAMCSPSEMDAPSEMFFFLFNTIPGCVLVFISLGLRI